MPRGRHFFRFKNRFENNNLIKFRLAFRLDGIALFVGLLQMK